MNKSATLLCTVVFLATFAGGCVSGVSVTDLTFCLGEIKANDNTLGAIRAEIRSDDFMALVARRTGVPKWRVRLSWPIVELPEYGSISYSIWARPDLVEAAARYIGMRRAGHSKAYAMARLGSEPDLGTVPEDCRVILEEDKDAYLPWLSLYGFNVQGGTHALYVILDGDLAWSYMVGRLSDRTLIGCHTDLFDGKELLPKYRKAFDEVDAQVEKEMKAEGSRDQFGACHVYWSRKKELLKKRGIEWQSPADLHPGTSYD